MGLVDIGVDMMYSDIRQNGGPSASYATDTKVAYTIADETARNNFIANLKQSYS